MKRLWGVTEIGCRMQLKGDGVFPCSFCYSFSRIIFGETLLALVEQCPSDELKDNIYEKDS